MVELHAERMKDSGPSGGGGGNHKHAGSLTLEEHEAFAGTTCTSLTMVSPELLEYVKADMTRTSELMMSILKARESREQMAKKKCSLVAAEHWRHASWQCRPTA